VGCSRAPLTIAAHLLPPLLPAGSSCLCARACAVARSAPRPRSSRSALVLRRGRRMQGVSAHGERIRRDELRATRHEQGGLLHSSLTSERVAHERGRRSRAESSTRHRMRASHCYCVIHSDRPPSIEQVSRRSASVSSMTTCLPSMRRAVSCSSNGSSSSGGSRSRPCSRHIRSDPHNTER
jgi:hypothetical protein